MRMTRLVATLAILIAPATAAAQMDHGSEMSGWKELDAFHKVLAASWHPAGSGDTKPARAQAQALLDAARAWQKSKGPAACENQKTRDGLKEMITALNWHADAVKREASDDALKVTLKRAHDTFESFAESCMMKHEGMVMKKPPV